MRLDYQILLKSPPPRLDPLLLSNNGGNESFPVCKQCMPECKDVGELIICTHENRHFLDAQEVIANGD